LCRKMLQGCKYSYLVSIPKQGNIRYFSWMRARHLLKTTPSLKDVQDKEENEAAMVDQELSKMKVNLLLKIGRHTNITAAGKVNSFSALILLGNGNGMGGLGYGKGDKVAVCMKKASLNALRNLIPIYRYQDKTIPVPVTAFYRSSTVVVIPNKAAGIIAAPKLHSVAEAFGVTDITIKTYGTEDINKKVRALIKAFTFHSSPEDTAKKLGRKFVNLNKIIYERRLRQQVQMPRNPVQDPEIDISQPVKETDLEEFEEENYPGDDELFDDEEDWNS